jgi:Flp pilus assembly protein TadG
MMKLFEKRAGKKTRGQTMVEFALILPVLLMTMYGVMEFGRLLFIYVTTTSAAREATRYASASFADFWRLWNNRH